MDGPTWIVCRDERQAQRVRKRTKPGDQVRVVSPSIHQIRGANPPQVVIVCEGVELWKDIGGEGPFGRLLENRMKVWGDKARFIEL